MEMVRYSKCVCVFMCSAVLGMFWSTDYSVWKLVRGIELCQPEERLEEKLVIANGLPLLLITTVQHKHSLHPHTHIHGARRECTPSKVHHLANSINGQAQNQMTCLGFAWLIQKDNVNIVWINEVVTLNVGHSASPAFPLCMCVCFSWFTFVWVRLHSWRALLDLNCALLMGTDYTLYQHSEF